MRKHLRIVASLSLLMALCSVFTMGFTVVSKAENAKEIVRNWDPGETKPLVIL